MTLEAAEALSGAIALIGYGLAAIGPGIGIGIVVGNADPGHGPSARGGRHGPDDHVPGHRLHRGAGPDRLRALLHRLRGATGC